LLMIIGIIIGLCLGVFLGKTLIISLTSGMGWPSFPYFIPISVLTISMTIFILFSSFSSWISVQERAEVRPVQLNTE
jgi:hypothetical protein